MATSLVLYVDGSVFDGKAGIGLQCPRDNKLCLGLPCEESDPNIVELLAIIEGLERAAAVGYLDTVHLYTDSEAVYNIIRMPGNFNACWPPHYRPFGQRFVDAKKRIKLPHIHLTTNTNDRNHKIADQRAREAALA